jgi:hypothetical protein
MKKEIFLKKIIKKIESDGEFLCDEKLLKNPVRGWDNLEAFDGQFCINTSVNEVFVILIRKIKL